MGRPERLIDPAGGPVERFACRMRKLREEAGSPSYRQLAASAHYSATVLSRAAGGSELASLPVTLAFVEACGGDRQEWTHWWTEARDERDATRAAGDAAADRPALNGQPLPQAVPPPAPARGRGDWIGWVRGRTLRQVILIAAVLIVTASGSVVGLDGGTGPGKQGPGLAPGWTTARQNGGDLVEPISPGSMDGDDPRARGCDADATVLQAIPIYLPGGTVRFGTLRLRHSDHCGTDWASAYYSNRDLYTITLISLRPADGAETRFSWSNNTPPGSYGNMLSTALGCVWVQATVTTPLGTSKPVRTKCLR
jgi:hypothetical protein